MVSQTWVSTEEWVGKFRNILSVYLLFKLLVNQQNITQKYFGKNLSLADFIDGYTKFLSHMINFL